MTAPVVEARVINEKGKCLFAKKSFHHDEVILEEAPLVSCQFVWNKFYNYRACDYCMRPLETAEENARRLTGNLHLRLPHLECCAVQKLSHVVCPHCQVVYCCDECRQAAWSRYHQVLCQGSSIADPLHPLNILQETWRNAHFPPETATIMLIARMIATVMQSEDKASILACFSNFQCATSNEQDNIVHKLLGEKFQDQIEVLRNLVISTLYDQAVHEWLTADGFQSLLALIGTNQQGIGTSSLSAYVHNCDKLDLPADERAELDEFIDTLYVDIEKESGTFLNCEGSGLYFLQSTCNHSCVPNAEIQFPHNNHKLCLVALEGIPEGAEICISYLDECSLRRSRHSRQKLLRENYLFNCTCSKCEMEADQGNITSEDDDDNDDGNEIGAETCDKMDQVS